MRRTMLKSKIQTYTIAGERGSGVLQVNGAAARLVHAGDTVIVLSYAEYEPDELAAYRPHVVHVDATNRILPLDDDPAVAIPGP